MKTYIVFLRAVNVGGTGKMPMADLREICVEIGLSNVKTYIQSGNIVISSVETIETIKAKLETRLFEYAQKNVGVIIRRPEELSDILKNNPFKKCAPNRTIVTFIDGVEPSFDGIKNQKSEEIALGDRAIYVHYGEGMAESRLLIPAAKTGTARNINTITKILEMAEQI